MTRIGRVASSVVLWGMLMGAGWIIRSCHEDRDAIVLRIGRAAEAMTPRPIHKDPPPDAERIDSMWMRRKLEDDPDFLRHREERRAARKAATR